MRAAWAALAVLAACTRPAEDRAVAELDVGRASDGAGVSVVVEDGLAAVRSIEPGALALWAQAPVLTITFEVGAGATRDWTITVDNALPDAELTGGVDVTPYGWPPTRRAWQVALPAAGTVELTLAPLDAAELSAWRFAAMADIQTALPEVNEVFEVIGRDDSIRFVISMGDLTQWGKPYEYDLYEEQLATLGIPYYATIGNHELYGDPAEWLRRFGRFNVHFDFRGVAFSLVDSGSATIDPLVHTELDGWLDDAIDRIHVFATHYPPIAPTDLRGEASFASQREAAGLLERLAAARVDLTLYGHVHTHSAFENAGIPARISGGGGALPVAFDGISRHFLVVDVDAAADRVTDVEVVRVDEPYDW
jgi:3',5'-cyclic AMP phosphodiesterase CpdA